MTIKRRPRPGKIEIDLSGPQGNAFYLLALGQQLAKRMDKDWDDISKRMKSGDYNNFIKVFDAEFGTVVDLYK